MPHPTKKCRPETFCPDMTVIPSRREREIGLGIARPVRRHTVTSKCLVINLADTGSSGYGGLIFSRWAHDLQELDTHLE
jgi:hypothetical protein